MFVMYKFFLTTALCAAMLGVASFFSALPLAADQPPLPTPDDPWNPLLEQDLALGLLVVVLSMGGVILMLLFNIMRRREAAIALSASQQRYKQLANFLPQAVFESDQDGRILFGNQLAFELFGYSMDDYKNGLYLDQMVIPEQRERVRKKMIEVVNGNPTIQEFIALRKDGSTFPAEVNSAPRLQDDRVVGLRGLVYDLTERKKAEEEFRRSEQRFRNIVQATPIGMHIYQLTEKDELILVGANPAADRILNLSHEYLFGKPIEEAFPGIGNTEMPETYRQIAREGGFWTEEQVNYQDEVLAGAFEVHVFQVAPNIAAGMFMDITDRIRSSQAIQDALARFEAVISNTPVVAIQGFDRQGVVHHWNAASQRIYGFMASEAIGKRIQDLLFTPQSAGEFDLVLEDIWRRGAPTEPREWQVIDANGEERWVFSTIFPIFESGKIVEAFCMDVDITDRHLAEEGLRRSEQRYRTLFEKAQDAIFIEELDDRIVDANPSASEMVGYTLEELKQMYISDLVGDKSRGKSIIRKELEQHPGRVFETVDVHKNGRLINVEVSTTQIADNLVLSIVRDVTERKKNEELLRKINRAMYTISECNQILVRATDEAELLDKICQVIHQRGGYRFVWVGFAMPDHTIKPVSYAGYEAGYLKLLRLYWGSKEGAEGPMATAIHTTQPAMVTDIKNTTWSDEAHKRGYAAILALPLFYEQEVFGSLGIYADRPNAFTPDEITLLKELAEDLSYGIHTLRVRADNRRANEMLQKTSAELQYAYDATLEGWSHALELRERETAGHSRRVVELALHMGRTMGMSREELEHFRRGALLHDIGKMGIPDNILLKPGPLSDEEWVIMRQHPVYAYQLLKEIPYLEPALQVPYSHHERWDGSGYPLGLKGEEIPLAARIFAVVDVWDALTSDRPYRPAWTATDVSKYLRKNAGTLFDAQIVDLFLELNKVNADGTE